MKRHQLTDEQWELLKPLIRHKVARTGRPPKEPQQMLNGIFWILGTGAPWRDLPERFGPWQTVYDHFWKWRSGGVFAGIIGVPGTSYSIDNVHDEPVYEVLGWRRPRLSPRRRLLARRPGGVER